MFNLDVVDLSRLQFALTAMYHFIFVPLTLGLAFIIAIMESVYVMTGRTIWKRMTMFWGTLFGINFALGVGTGVVIVEDGTILTNFHVISNAQRLEVTFFDGLESPAMVISTMPENDLAVIKPQKIPDDLQPATMGSSSNLLPGDEVVAVGFPFGIGPSVSAGVVSGLNRSFKPEGQMAMKGLIQFDAAANPGNSGGPLVNMAGEVVGIVTAILNPSGAKTFIGIGFATTIESVGTSVGIPPF